MLNEPHLRQLQERLWRYQLRCERKMDHGALPANGPPPGAEQLP